MITRERVLELLDFDGQTFRWKTTRAGRGCQQGKLAGSIKDEDPYRRICLDGKRYYAHRLAWLIHHGTWPTLQIDHINGNRDDNRIDNLREVTNAENAKNQKRHTHNKSGVTGVHWSNYDQRWVAGIESNGKRITLGRFKDKNAAIAAREAANQKYGFHPNHGKR